MIRYILNILIAFDQLVNTIFGGYPDETISAAAYRGELQGRWAGKIMRPVIDTLFYPIERDHCFSAWLSEYNHSQRP